MKSLILLFALIFITANTNAAVKTILKVEKSVNTKNVLHYKVGYDKSSCTFTTDVYAEWKMDEEDGHWKPLSKSNSIIRKPLWPTTSKLNNREMSFVTNAIDEFQQQGVIQSSDIALFIEKKSNGKCNIRNLVLIDGRDINVESLYTKINFFGTVKRVIVNGEGFESKASFKKDVKL